MKESRTAVRVTPRGRIAHWSREQLDKLSTLELRALLANAERLNETEVAALCTEILSARPRGFAVVRRERQPGEARKLVTRTRAFEIHGVSLRNRLWSCGGIRTDGAVLLTLRSEETQKAGALSTSLLWAPNVAASHPWSDTPAGQERLEHCRIAIERGAAQGLMTYSKLTPGAAAEAAPPRGGDRVDAENVLELRVEMRGEEYWASWTPARRVVVNTFE